MQEAQNNQAEISLPEGTEALVAEIIDPSLGKQNVPDSLPETPAESKTEAGTNPFMRIEWKGKKHDLDQTKAKAYAQKGFDYEQNIAKLKQEREQMRSQMEKFSKYGDEGRLNELFQLDEFSRKHPDFLEAVKSEWSRRQGQGAEAQSSDSTPANAALSQLAEKISALEAKHNEAEVFQATEQLDSELADLKSSNEFIEWDSADDLGYTKEHEILKLVAEKGVTAKQAFWMLYGEQAAEHRAKEAARKREETYKENFKRTRAIGDFFGGKPAKAAGPKAGQSYDDIGKQIMKDFNIN